MYCSIEVYAGFNQIYVRLLVVEAHRPGMLLISGEMTRCHCQAVKLSKGACGYLKGFVHVWLVPACCLFFLVEAPCYNRNQPAVHLAAVAGDNSRRKFTGLFGNFSQHRGGGSSQFPKLL